MQHIRAMAFGTFDLLHKGHLHYLSEAAKSGTELIIVIARDARVEKKKGRLPIHNENERLEKVQNAFPKATVMLGDKDDILAPLRKYIPDILVFWYDQYVPEAAIKENFPTMKVVRVWGFEVETYKSSKLRELI